MIGKERERTKRLVEREREREKERQTDKYHAKAVTICKHEKKFAKGKMQKKPLISFELTPLKMILIDKN